MLVIESGLPSVLESGLPSVYLESIAKRLYKHTDEQPTV